MAERQCLQGERMVPCPVERMRPVVEAAVRLDTMLHRVNTSDESIRNLRQADSDLLMAVRRYMAEGE